MLRRLTFSNVCAALALFISLGGTSYAVVKLPKNSVSSIQVRDHSLKSVDLAGGVVPAAIPGPAGARGPRGEIGPTGAPGANGANGINGTSPTAEAWQNLSFASPWTNYGSGYFGGQFRKDGFGVVHLRGLVKTPTAPQSDDIIATLPTGYRPKAHVLLTTWMAKATADGGPSPGRLDIVADGTIRIEIATATGGYVQLDNIEFPTD